MATHENIQLFISLFRGRNDIYAKRWEKNGKGGYSPAYAYSQNPVMLETLDDIGIFYASV